MVNKPWLCSRQETFHVVLTDLKMPGITGVEVIRELKTLSPSTMGIIHTAYGSVETAVAAMKAGAYDYVTKPVRRDELLVVIQRALEFQRLHYENISLRKQLKAKYKFDNIISDNEKMQAIFAQVEKVADTDSTVIIYGESGTGKELIARALHYNSYRQDKPLIPINCGAIPEDLLESELFGHEKGSFTGATALRLGRFELAHGGTIFLDEIGEMRPALQVKLLRVLQEREFERIGGTRTIKVDVRILAATNKNLEDLVERQQFRDDLYWRLNVIPMTLPPLRERLSDIPLLVAHFITRFNAEKKAIPDGYHSGSPADAAKLSLAGQCARTRKYHGTHRHPERQRHDCAGRPARENLPPPPRQKCPGGQHPRRRHRF